jgi:hypothetical protein
MSPVVGKCQDVYRTDCGDWGNYTSATIRHSPITTDSESKRVAAAARVGSSIVAKSRGAGSISAA